MSGDIFNNEITPRYKAIKIRRRIRISHIYVGTYGNNAAPLSPLGRPGPLVSNAGYTESRFNILTQQSYIIFRYVDLFNRLIARPS